MCFYGIGITNPVLMQFFPLLFLNFSSSLIFPFFTAATPSPTLSTIVFHIIYIPRPWMPIIRLLIKISCLGVQEGEGWVQVRGPQHYGHYSLYSQYWSLQGNDLSLTFSFYPCDPDSWTPQSHHLLCFFFSPLRLTLSFCPSQTHLISLSPQPIQKSKCSLLP